MDAHCMKCQGLIPEPNKAYGYSGKFCHCEKPEPQKIEVTISESVFSKLTSDQADDILYPGKKWSREKESLLKQLEELQKIVNELEYTPGLTLLDRLEENRRLKKENEELRKEIAKLNEPGVRD